MNEQFTIRIYDGNLVKNMNEVYRQNRNSYTTKNQFLVDCVVRGFEAIKREQGGLKNIESVNQLYDEIHNTFENLKNLMKICEDNAKENIANLSVNQKLLSCNYNMLLGLSENVPKKREYVEGGMYDVLPDRMSEVLEDVLKVYLKK